MILKVFLITFVVFLIVVLAMAVGYIFQRKSIQGSCGGIASLGLEKECDCPEPCDARKARMEKEARRQKLLAEKRIV